MKMKNVLMILISLAVVFAMAGAAGANDVNQVNQNSQDQKADTQVTYTMNEGYIVTIPVSVSLSMEGNEYEATGSEPISADNVRINAGKVLKVNISGHDYGSDGGKWVLKETQGSGELTYTIKKGDSELGNNAVVLSVQAGTGWDRGSFTRVSETLSFKTEEVTISGSFEDTLTFTVSVEPSQTP